MDNVFTTADLHCLPVARRMRVAKMLQETMHNLAAEIDEQILEEARGGEIGGIRIERLKAMHWRAIESRNMWNRERNPMR